MKFLNASRTAMLLSSTQTQRHVTEVQMTKAKVLVIGSNATRIALKAGGTAAIGQYLNETVIPSMALIAAGYEVVLATPDGTKPHIDEVSDVAQHFGNDEAAHLRARRFYDS